MNWKRFIAILCTLILAISAIGCGGGAASSAAEAESKEEAAPAEESKEEAAPAEESKEEAAPAEESKEEAAPAEAAGSGEVRTTEEREDADSGTAVTPAGMSLQGIDEPGVIPKKKFFIAFSNGEMGNSFTRVFVDDMESVAKQYADQFGIRYEWTNAGNNSTQQLSDIQSLLAKNPDILICSPNEAEPLNVIVEWCEEAGVPLLIIDKELIAQPGEGTYVAALTYDFFLQGVQMGIGVRDYLYEKYGEYKGDVAEIAGIMGANASIERSQGMNLVLGQYPDINVVVMRAGEWDNSISYQVSQDILTTFPEGTIDVVVGNCDESCFAFKEAATAAGRTDIGAGYVGADSPVLMLDYILKGEAFATAENGPYYGYPTFEYAIRYLNGEDIPQRIMLPNRFWRITNDEQRAEMQRIVDECTAQNLEFVPASLGGFDTFYGNAEDVLKEYPVPLAEDRERYKDVPYYETTPSTIR